MNLRRFLAVLVLVLQTLAVVVPAAAQDTQGAAARLKTSADTAFDAKHFEEALALYDEAYAISPQPAILYDRGRALQYLARYPQALDQLERFDREATPELRAKVPGFDAVLDQVRHHVATVDLQCAVPGARVLVGSVSVGTTPLPGPLRVTAGRQRIEVLAEGYYPFHRDLDLPGATVTNITAPLESKDHHGLLVVRSAIEGTSIFIDGAAIGFTPTEAALLEGAHGVRASHPGFDDASTQIVLRAGQEKDLTLDPRKKPSILSRWWFWTAVGVVLAGTAAALTIYAFTTEQAPPNGNFSPGTASF